MPFLRVVRDKRGYETTYLMHWYREGSRQRSRILYVFRTPGGVRVGRDALEPEMLRTIESQHPDIAFDWKAVLDNRQIIESTAEPRRPRKRRRSDEAAEPAAQPPPPPAETVTALAPPAQPPLPSAIEGATPDEQIAFLARWYAEIRERIPRRTTDPARQEALLALAERLNPAGWTDADAIAVGLQEAAQALERLSRVFTRRRRRSRRKPAASTADEAPANPPSASESDLPASDE